MQILYNKEEKVLVIMIELYQRQENIEIGVAQPTTSITHLCYARMAYNRCVTALVILIDHNSTINPYRKLIDEISLNFVERIIRVYVSDILWIILP